MRVETLMRDACVIGHPVVQSLSSVMHSAGFKAAGLDWSFHAVDVPPEKLREALDGLRFIRGASITMPHKQAVIPMLDGISPEAREIGAVNVVVNEDGRLLGANTDGAGFVRYLDRDLSIKPKNATILGAGGSARAIAYALAVAGTCVTVCARRIEQARDVAALAGPRGAATLWDERADAMRADLVVSTIPFAADSQIDPGALANAGVVVDIAGLAIVTPLQKAARKAGLTVYNGLGMLLHQGFLAFRMWTGIDAPEAVMRAAVESHPGV